jgi:short-subunit dehydrogenase
MAKTSYTLITGASRGIGKELAVEAAKDGRNLILISQQKQPLEQVARMLTSHYRGAIEILVQDLSKPGAAEVIYKELTSRGLRIDTLINNAGLGDYGEFKTSDPQRLHDMLIVNIVALTELTRLFLPDLLKQKQARIMNVASVTGFLPGPFMSVYFATKHYVLAFSEGLREELRASPVVVTALCPPPVNTAFVQGAHIAQGNYMATSNVTAEKVARYGYRAMKKGKAVAVYSLRYKLLTALIVRITPRFALRKILYRLNS